MVSASIQLFPSYSRSKTTCGCNLSPSCYSLGRATRLHGHVGSAAMSRTRCCHWAAVLFHFVLFGCQRPAAQPAPTTSPKPSAEVASFAGTRAGEEREVVGVKLCWCPPGKFTMGSPPNEPERRPGEDQVGEERCRTTGKKGVGTLFCPRRPLRRTRDWHRAHDPARVQRASETVRV